MTQLIGFSWHSQKRIQVLCLSPTFNMHFSLLIQEQLLKGIMYSENTIFSYEVEQLSQGWIESGSF